jgi:invasion protein IalB
MTCWPATRCGCNTAGVITRYTRYPTRTKADPAVVASRRFRGLATGLGALLAFVASVAAETTTFEHWSLECGEPHPGRSSCSLFQNVVLAPEQGGGRVMRVTIGLIDGEQTPLALFVLPLGISLPPGVELEVPGIDAVRFPVERCEPSGCGGGLRLDNELLAALGSADHAVVRFRDSQREPVELQLSLKGFAAGVEALRKSHHP